MDALISIDHNHHKKHDSHRDKTTTVAIIVYLRWNSPHSQITHKPTKAHAKKTNAHILYKNSHLVPSNTNKNEIITDQFHLVAKQTVTSYQI